MLERQRTFARQPGGAVLDGRDIGTVITPDADAKLFITASLGGARRRGAMSEILGHGQAADLAAIETEIAARDVRDAGRASAPLARAHDADLLDTSNLTIGAAIQSAIVLVDARLRGRRLGDWPRRFVLRSALFAFLSCSASIGINVPGFRVDMGFMRRFGQRPPETTGWPA